MDAINVQKFTKRRHSGGHPLSAKGAGAVELFFSNLISLSYSRYL
jgi:hypothetical protein